MPSCSPHPFSLTQQGRLLYPGSEATRFGPERPNRISRVNRLDVRLCYGAAVCYVPDDSAGCLPPTDATDIIIGFALQVTEEDILPGLDYVPPFPFGYPPGDMACISRNDRIRVVAPCDVFVGDPVYVAPGTGLPAETGLLAGRSTWESQTMAGTLGVIQIATETP